MSCREAVAATGATAAATDLEPKRPILQQVQQRATDVQHIWSALLQQQHTVRFTVRKRAHLDTRRVVSSSLCQSESAAVAGVAATGGEMRMLDERPDELGIRERLRKSEHLSQCPCGTGERYFGEGSGATLRHAYWHLEWDRGVVVPLTVAWMDSLAVITSESTAAEQKVAYKLGRLFQREKHYDFPMVPEGRTWRRGELHQTLIAVHNYRAIGVLITYPQFRWGVWDGSPGAVPFEFDSVEPVPEIVGIWVARGYRRQGVGSALVSALAQHAETRREHLIWSLPLSDDGKAMAFNFQESVRVSR